MTKTHEDDNYVTTVELGDIAVVLISLTGLDARLKERSSSVSIADVPIYDSNGDLLGVATYLNGEYVFRAGDDE